MFGLTTQTIQIKHTKDNKVELMFPQFLKNTSTCRAQTACSHTTSYQIKINQLLCAVSLKNLYEDTYSHWISKIHA